MPSPTAAECFIQADKDKGSKGDGAVIAPDLDVARFNRGFVLNSREASLGGLRQFASAHGPNRHFERVVVGRYRRPRELVRLNPRARLARHKVCRRILTCQVLQHDAVRRGRHSG